MPGLGIIKGKKEGGERGHRHVGTEIIQTTPKEENRDRGPNMADQENVEKKYEGLYQLSKRPAFRLNKGGPGLEERVGFRSENSSDQDWHLRASRVREWEKFYPLPPSRGKEKKLNTKDASICGKRKETEAVFLNEGP